MVVIMFGILFPIGVSGWTKTLFSSPYHYGMHYAFGIRIRGFAVIDAVCIDMIENKYMLLGTCVPILLRVIVIAHLG